MTNTLHHAMVSFAAMVFHHVAVALGALLASPATIVAMNHRTALHDRIVNR